MEKKKSRPDLILFIYCYLHLPPFFGLKTILMVLKAKYNKVKTFKFFFSCVCVYKNLNIYIYLTIDYNAEKGFHQWHNYQQKCIHFSLTFLLVLIFSYWVLWFKEREAVSDFFGVLRRVFWSNCKPAVVVPWTKGNSCPCHVRRFLQVRICTACACKCRTKVGLYVRRCIFKKTNSKCQPSPSTVGKKQWLSKLITLKISF